MKARVLKVSLNLITAGKMFFQLNYFCTLLKVNLPRKQPWWYLCSSSYSEVRHESAASVDKLGENLSKTSHGKKDRKWGQREGKGKNLPNVSDLFVSNVAFKETVQDIFLYSGLLHSVWPLHINTHAHTLGPSNHSPGIGPRAIRLCLLIPRDLFYNSWSCPHRWGEHHSWPRPWLGTLESCWGKPRHTLCRITFLKRSIMTMENKPVALKAAEEPRRSRVYANDN